MRGNRAVLAELFFRMVSRAPTKALVLLVWARLSSTLRSRLNNLLPRLNLPKHFLINPPLQRPPLPLTHDDWRASSLGNENRSDGEALDDVQEEACAW